MTTLEDLEKEMCCERIDTHNSESNVMNAMENVVTLAKGSELGAPFWVKAKGSYEFIAKTLGITDKQAVILSLLTNCDLECGQDFDDIAKFTRCLPIKLLGYLNDIDELMRLGYIESESKHNNRRNYIVTTEAVEAFKGNKKVQPPKTVASSVCELLEMAGLAFDKHEKGRYNQKQLTERLKMILNANTSFNFTKALLAYDFAEIDFTLVMYLCFKLVVENDDTLYRHELDAAFDRILVRTVSRCISNGITEAQKVGLVEWVNQNGMSDHSCIRLSNKAKSNLLSEAGIKVDKNANKGHGVILHKEIIAKKMFYNSTEQHQVDRLKSLLENKQFASVCKKLKTRGMRTGFACLFYGKPGTGKTETVLQLAKATGRDIVQVDIPQIKSMWVGESEKNVKAIFDNYRMVVKNSKVAPILLFNEADAVLGTRMETTRSSVDKMENAMQNIILQEMEDLNGIMIATTNLSDNLDKAFERRFLYKVKFENPSLEAKASIWQSMIPDLSREQAEDLAEHYDFSGGQIENIARKKNVDDILNCTEGIDMDAITGYCDEELLNGSQTERPHVGFN